MRRETQVTAKFAVTLTFQSEGNTPQEVAQRALEAIGPVIAHPVVLCQIQSLDGAEFTAGGAAPVDQARATFDGIMAAPDA